MIRYCVFSVSQTGARKYRGCFVDYSRNTGANVLRLYDALEWADRFKAEWAREGYAYREVDEDTR